MNSFKILISKLFTNRQQKLHSFQTQKLII